MSSASPRDVITKVFGVNPTFMPPDGRYVELHAEQIEAVFDALTAAGYSVVREGELDAATVERCALAADAFYYDHPVASAEIRDALRALAEAKP